MPKTLKMLPKWRNFAQYGHTGRKWLSISQKHVFILATYNLVCVKAV